VDKRGIKNAFANKVLNPVVRRAVGAGIAPPSIAILETVGRKSGQPRRTPVGNGIDGDTFWIVAEDGRRAAYVRNLQANPRVRIKTPRGPWRTGTAHLMPDDDPRERLRNIGRRGSIGLKLNAATVRVVGTDPMTVRIDLDRN
jgi:deazaflavin-dependent oxidoreductase (nitroreductase family)